MASIGVSPAEKLKKKKSIPVKLETTETENTMASRAPPKKSLSTPKSSKTVACTQCKHKFADKVKLQQHMKTHSGPRYYKCDQCASKYKIKDNFVKHRKTKHTSAGIVVRKKVGTRIKSEEHVNSVELEWNDNHDFGEFIIDGLYLSDENNLNCRVRNLDCFSTRNLNEMKVHRETYHQLLEQRIPFEKWMHVLPNRFVKIKQMQDVIKEKVELQVPKDADPALEVDDDKRLLDPVKKKQFGDLLVKLKNRHAGR